MTRQELLAQESVISGLYEELMFRRVPLSADIKKTFHQWMNRITEALKTCDYSPVDISDRSLGVRIQILQAESDARAAQIKRLTAEVKELRELWEKTEAGFGYAQAELAKLRRQVFPLEERLPTYEEAGKRLNELSMEAMGKMSDIIDEYIKKSAPKEKKDSPAAMKVLTDALSSDPIYYQGWIENIARAFMDEVNSSNNSFADSWLLSMGRGAADRFLKSLLQPTKGEREEYKKGSKMEVVDSFDTYPGGIHYHGRKYWITPAKEYEEWRISANKFGEIQAIYLGKGVFLYNGREVRMKPGTKANEL